MISLEDYFRRMSLVEPPSDEVQVHATHLLARVNSLLQDCLHIEAAKHPVVNSGWRSQAYNGTIANAATKSRHITGEAIDLSDPEGDLDEYLYNNPQLLEKHGLWCEHPASTKNWCHLQSVPPRSGNRHFFP